MERNIGSRKSDAKAMVCEGNGAGVSNTTEAIGGGSLIYLPAP